MTSYNELWEYFLDMSGLYNEEIPNDENEIKKEIRNSIRSYNTKIDNGFVEKLKFDNDLEEISLDKEDDNYDIKFKILALFIEKELQTKSLKYFQSVWQFDQKEIKSKFYKDQVTARQKTISDLNKEISQLFSYMTDYNF